MSWRWIVFTPGRPRDLANHACLQFRFPHTGKLQAWPLLHNEEDAGLNLPVSMISNNVEARICFAIHELGIAYLPDFASRDALAAGKLVTVLDEYTRSGGTFLSL